MAKKGKLETNARRIKKVADCAPKRMELKKKAANMNLTEEERMDARIRLNKMPKNSSPLRIRNRCTLSGRPRGFLRKFGLSRIAFREMANKGLLPGVTKSSW